MSLKEDGVGGRAVAGEAGEFKYIRVSRLRTLLDQLDEELLLTAQNVGQTGGLTILGERDDIMRSMTAPNRG